MSGKRNKEGMMLRGKEVVLNVARGINETDYDALKTDTVGDAIRTKFLEEPPLRSELYGIHQLEQHAKTLAGWHRVDPRRGSDRLLARLADNETFLHRTYRLILAAIKSNRKIAPAAEWLTDNFYLIEEQVRMARRHLPKGYSRELPRLLNGPWAGFPRVYDIVLELISHVDGRVDAENVSCLIGAYQQVSTLSLGELWAIPIMLRLALIENLRRVAVRIAVGRRDRDEADLWADRILETAERAPKDLVLVLADMARSNPPGSSAFVAEFTRKLQGQTPAVAIPLAWMQQRLSEEGSTIELQVQKESQDQAGDQVSIGNSINSLRFLEAMDWREFVEAQSPVEQILREDPVGVYPKMDFATRDRYRHAVERLARHSPCSEAQAAQMAVDLARAGKPQTDGDLRRRHVGFYLIDKGLPQLERAVKLRPTVKMRLESIGRRGSLFFYLATIGLLTAMLTAVVLTQGYVWGLRLGLLLLVSVPVLLGASQAVIALINRFSTTLVPPATLPRMGFRQGIPPEFRTLVVVPTMLKTANNIDNLIEDLEVRYLANRDDHVHFALLTDFGDADRQTLPEDEELVERVSEGVLALNEKYQDLRDDIFFLFHRPRRWNPGEGVWMGYERKRVKLGELNLLLRGQAQDRFSLVVGQTAILPRVKYILTLDTDTQLPRDSVQYLVETMAHPLNRPRYDKKRQRVCEGYGILQPRVEIDLLSTRQSRFARLFGGEPGIDPYTRAVSDLYQDLFKEGSFVGKGIYDLDVFEQTLAGRFPENRILSHDLLEGCYVRSALVSDIRLMEEYSPNYLADSYRRHRWIRGDWQIASWIWPWIFGLDARSHRNPLSLLSRWKVFDNLRRSLVPCALMVLLMLGWTLLPVPGFWSLTVLGFLLFPPLLITFLDLVQKPEDTPLKLHLRTTARSVGRHLAQSAFFLVSFPHEACFSLDAILRTGVRILITHKRLLEWQTFHDINGKVGTGLGEFVRTMWIAPVTAVGVAFYLAVFRLEALVWAGLFCAAWLISPLVAWWLSRPLAVRKIRLAAEQFRFLHTLSRKTWRFFETLVDSEDHWLIPDNIQEDPDYRVAHRTSPTNLGLGLLSNLAAYDFGYLSTGSLIERTSQTLGTMENLERFRGHFLNWYDTRTLNPLFPKYVSTVDSGNLAGCLLILRIGLMGLPDTRIYLPRAFDGITDTLSVIADMVEAGKKVPADFPGRMAQMFEDLTQVPASLSEAYTLGDQLVKTAEGLVRGLPESSDRELFGWTQALERQCRELFDEITLLAPWGILLPEAEEFRRQLTREGEKYLHEVLDELNRIPTLSQVAGLEERMRPIIDELAIKTAPMTFFSTAEDSWCTRLRRSLRKAGHRAASRLKELQRLTLHCTEMSDMDLDFLYDSSLHLLAIGYKVGDQRRETSYYDLLASEARLGSFIAIAQGRLPTEHWFALGRLLTTWNGQQTLISWSGSMFEYLMPLLIMPTFPDTLLDQTCKTAVNRQIGFGLQQKVPWGISESGYNTTDIHLNYQYRAFGVPGLGFKRGLFDDLVIAPYASVLALMVKPEDACRNLERMARAGLVGRFGFYEAIDYTPARIPPGKPFTIVRSFMAHHQAMSLLSLAHLLLNQPMQKRFASEPMFQAAELLLQERIPKTAPHPPYVPEESVVQRMAEAKESFLRIFRTPHTSIPEVHLLSNGRYSVMITNSGGGYSRWKDLAVTRWREDPTLDNTGTFCYLRDTGSGEFWSVGYQPAQKKSKHYEAIFSQERAELRRRDFDIDTHVEIAVSPEDDIELRRINITNHGQSSRTLELTSYAEVVLTTQAADVEHPAFHKLFMQTEIVTEHHAILCTRRPRDPREETPWMFHLMTVYTPGESDSSGPGEISYETDRMKFIGRGRTLMDPEALTSTSRLSNSQGAVLDPIVAIRRRITIGPGQTARVDIVNGIAPSRDTAIALGAKYHDRRLADRVFELAWTRGQVLLNQLNANESDAQLYGRLSGSILYANPACRAASSILLKNQRGQSGLWGYGVSGDYPLVLLRIGDLAKLELVQQLVQAHAYWRSKGLVVDMVIWNEDHSGYRQVLQDRIMGVITASTEVETVDQPGGIFVRRGEQMSEEDRILFQTVARVVLSDTAGTLKEQVERRSRMEGNLPAFVPTLTRIPERIGKVQTPSREQLFFNGIGGFTPDGREYTISPPAGQMTPAPWVNVLANPHFGTVISESGGSYTWLENAHEFRLTPWYNDPVCDTTGEAMYLRDEEAGHFWSPTSLPVRSAMPYLARHGFGYSVFEHVEDGIKTELWVYVAIDLPVKFMVLKVQNLSGRTRRLSATNYVEWVLGDSRHKTAMYVTTEIDPVTGAVFARNPYHPEFSNRVAFLDANEPSRGVTGDRREFLGRNGRLANPAALNRMRLSGKVGPGLDPCAALQIPFELADGQERQIVFTLGLGQNVEDAQNLTLRCRSTGSARGELERVWNYWNHTLGAVYVETPDPAINILTNGWLLYQTLACRMWGRSGYYQSGGAFGFRDQLQDAMALIHCEPGLLREQLLRCAAHQFREGDVQHWWHDPSGRGVRTHISDDYLWLPMAVCRYVRHLGDTGVLEEQVPFLEGRPVKPEEDSYYDLPARTQETATLYEHCVRAIVNGLRFGQHGLPLMGSGDWNDGMNRVGEGGKGESVWLAFFLYRVLQDFSEISLRRNDLEFVKRCVVEMNRLKKNVEENAWDGRWFRRAYFDNGNPLGSEKNTECQIDSLPQSWAVLSGLGQPEQVKSAMDEVYQRLVDRNHALVRLFDPPFEKSALNPGYVQGYVPGVRENGGQYTHAAIWAAMGFAALGDPARAWELTSFLNPILHGSTPEQIAVYRAEPYVMAADVYAAPPYVGRGGWTWYTGSAGWMYRLIAESLLGLRLEVDKLHFEPCLPDTWKTFKIHYRYRETFFHITLLHGGGNTIKRVILDGSDQPDKALTLIDDRRDHFAQVETE